MKKSRYTDEQIIWILKQHEAGTKTVDLCCEQGISTASFCGSKSKSKYGGLGLSHCERGQHGCEVIEPNRRYLRVDWVLPAS
jgi:putative transposase